MTAFCQCPYETASNDGSDAHAGVMLCAVCARPKAREGIEQLLPYPLAAQSLSLPESILRSLVASGSVVPTVRRGSFVRLLPSHVCAQLSAKGIKR